MFPAGPQRRVFLALELLVAVALIGALSFRALRAMDYLGADTMQHIRMTDSSRTAYVAKNLADGNGYTTNDLPSALVDFYDQKGKLHAAHWDNADRFPFAAYMTAALYVLTGSTSWTVGILAYNIVFFLAFLVLLYWLASSVWNDRYAGLAAVAIALLHPYTYYFLYWKEGDALFLTTACMALLVRYYRVPPGQVSRRLAVALGSVLAFVFLARPNLGVPMLLFLGVGMLRRLWCSRRELGVAGALRHHATRELLIPLVVIAWCIPFIVHSMAVWGQPLFNANNLYQLPLGTRYGMGTDTWWKYTEPGHLPTLGMLAHEAPRQLLAKFPTSWVVTVKHLLTSHGLEILLASGVFGWLWTKRPNQPAEATRTEPLRVVAWLMLFAVVMNLLVLPLYSYQSFSYRHYLSFGLPIVWIGAGRAVTALVERVRGPLAVVRDRLRANLGWVILAALVLVVVIGFSGKSSPDQPRIAARELDFLGAHWVGASLVLAVVLLRRWLVRPPWFPRIVALAFLFVFASYRPSRSMKRTNFVWLAVDQHVWDELRERHGLVTSFALQGEVAWNTGRQNIPAPEWPMHVYSFAYDHQLEVEDVYIESAQALVAYVFGTGAPGFEGYARLQEYRTLPGYTEAFHSERRLGYPKFRIKPLLKASTVFQLTDHAAIEAMRHSPVGKLELGDPKNVIYTAHGWEDYYVLDGQPVVTGTNITRSRYNNPDDAPYEDAGITFFVDDHIPRAVELDVYVPGPGSFQFFWSLDLYAYDRPSDRKEHQLGTLRATAAGWQHVRFEVPRGAVRHGLNKVGFRAAQFTPVIVCPLATSDAVCSTAFAARGPSLSGLLAGTTPALVHADVPAPVFPIVSLFARSLELIY